MQDGQNCSPRLLRKYAPQDAIFGKKPDANVLTSFRYAAVLVVFVSGNLGGNCQPAGG